MTGPRSRLLAGLLLLALAIGAVVMAPDPAILLGAARHVVGWIDRNSLWGGAAFLLFATLGKVTPVPGGVVVMLSAGFLFGPAVGPVLAAFGSALAAIGVTAAGRWVFPETIARIKGSRFAHYEEAVARDGIAYLAAIRILPIVPAWVGNLLPVAVDIRLRWVFLATLVGVAPLSIVMGGIGSRLQSLTEVTDFDVALLLDPATLLPLVGLLLVALLPVPLRRWRRRASR